MPSNEGRLPEWSDTAITYLTLKFPKFKFNFLPHKFDQVQSACPFKCKGGTDRLIVFENGNIYCRRCESKDMWRREPQEERQARLQKQEQSRQELRRQIATCQDWQRYYDNVGAGVELWHQHGITQEDIEKWGLGYCEQAPCCEYESPSLTIPIFYQTKLVDIRHRLVKPQGKDKYRSHLAGLPPAYFNLDGVKSAERVFVVEGEKKAVVCNHYGLPTIAFPGLQFARFLDVILPRTVDHCQELIFLPDPYSLDAMYPTLTSLKDKGYTVKIIDLFMKPDDLILAYGPNAITDSVPMARWF